MAFAAAGGAEVIDSAVARDGEEPGADGALPRIEGVHAVPDAEESFLHEVFGDAGVAHHAENERISDAAVAVVKVREGLWFAALEADDDIGVSLGGAKRQQDGQ